MALADATQRCDPASIFSCSRSVAERWATPTSIARTAREGMRVVTRTGRWSWTHFICAFVVFGLIAFLSMDSSIDALLPHLAKTLICGMGAGCAAARFGDAAWEKAVQILSWIF